MQQPNFGAVGAAVLLDAAPSDAAADAAVSSASMSVDAASDAAVPSALLSASDAAASSASVTADAAGEAGVSVSADAALTASSLPTTEGPMLDAGTDAGDAGPDAAFSIILPPLDDAVVPTATEYVPVPLDGAVSSDAGEVTDTDAAVSAGSTAPAVSSAPAPSATQGPVDSGSPDIDSGVTDSGVSAPSATVLPPPIATSAAPSATPDIPFDSGTDGGDAGTVALPDDDGDCSCRLAGHEQSTPRGLWLTGLLGLGLLRRRRVTR